jgi:hypothetical protein
VENKHAHVARRAASQSPYTALIALIVVAIAAFTLMRRARPRLAV